MAFMISAIWRRHSLSLVALVAIGGGLGLYFAMRIASPDVVLLFPEAGARWIRHNRPFRLMPLGVTEENAFFQKAVVAPPSGGPHVVTVRALRHCKVFWDRQQIFESPQDPDSWKQAHRIRLPHPIPPGEHVFGIIVDNLMGNAAALVYCESLGLSSGPDWEEWVNSWERAATVDDIELPEYSRMFPSPQRALATALWWIVPLFLIVWGCLFRAVRRSDRLPLAAESTAARCRWLVMGAWFVLAANNFTKLAPGLGYDLLGHVDYIRFIAERGELPDARGGPQMFQAPLYYLLSAMLYRALSVFGSADQVLQWLRWVPLLCGLAQIEICYRAARCLFPERGDLQIQVVLLGAMLPMNLYMSQVLGNEPLCGLLSAAILLCCWLGLSDPARARRSRWQWGVGLLLGMAMLTKMSALLLMIPVAVLVYLTNRNEKPPHRTGGTGSIVKSAARIFGTAGIIAGWFYFRNWLLFGKPFIGGWDREIEILWWQDPGYRTPWQLASFGHALFRPIHAGFFSIWDGFFSTMWMDGNLSGSGSWEFRPPWNQTLLLAAAWPGLLLSIAIIAGAVRGIATGNENLGRALRLAGGVVALYLVGFFFICLQVPAYSQAKASYTLGLLPAYAVLCVAGLDLLPSHPASRAAVMAAIVCWSVLVYGTYFVL